MKNIPDLKTVWSFISDILLNALYVLIVVGILTYIILYIDSLADNRPFESPLQLALVAAALGGFILIGAFYGDTPQHRLRLKRIAKFFLAAAISFIITFLLVNILHVTDPPTLGIREWFLVVVAAMAITLASIFFAMALVYLVGILRKL